MRNQESLLTMLKTMLNCQILSTAKMIGSKANLLSKLVTVGATGLTVSLFGFALPANAATFEFTFNNANNSPPGIVTGLITGLPENGVVQPASSVTVTSNTGGFGLGEYVIGAAVTSNAFSTVNGNITFANFLSTKPGGNTLRLTTLGNGGGLSVIPGPLINFGSLTFRRVREVPEPTAVIGLLGLGTLGLLARRKGV